MAVYCLDAMICNSWRLMRACLVVILVKGIAPLAVGARFSMRARKGTCTGVWGVNRVWVLGFGVSNNSDPLCGVLAITTINFGVYIDPPAIFEYRVGGSKTQSGRLTL